MNDVVYRHKVIVSLLLLLSLVSVYISLAIEKSKVDLSLNDVNCISGYVLYDSSYSENNNQVIKVRLTGCENIFNNKASAKGIITVVSKDDFFVSTNTKVKAFGQFSDNLFIASDLRVVEKKRINVIRERLILFLENRLIGQNPTDSDIILLMLLLGRSEDYKTEIKNLTKECSCIHILALSGMHLGILALVIKKLIRNKKLSKIVSFFVITAFVFIAGPKASLIRSYLMFLFAFLPIKERLAVAFLIQIFVFPFQVTDFGFIYGYLAVFSIVYLRPLIAKMLSEIPYFAFSKVIEISLSTCFLCIPLQFREQTKWSLSALFISSIASFLAQLLMILGLVILVCSRLRFLVAIQRYVYLLFENLFRYFSTFPKIGKTGYLILLLSLVALYLLEHLAYKSHMYKIKI